MIDRSFGDAGSRVVLEELLTGPEVSFFVVANGDDYVSLLSAQDHKRIFDDDRGPNTGGMGAFSPSPLMNDTLQSQIETTVVRPVLKGMAAEGNPFRGFLYCGLMLTPDGPKVIEFNVRFGDPEAQVVLPLLGLLAPVLVEASRTGSREPGTGSRTTRFPVPGSPFPDLRSRVAVGVVLAASGYPGEVRTGDAIHGLDDVVRDCPDVQLFYAGVKQKGSDLVTSGGRVVTVTATASSYRIAIARAYEAVSKIRFDGMQYRKDIGKRALANE